MSGVRSTLLMPPMGLTSAEEQSYLVMYLVGVSVRVRVRVRVLGHIPGQG